MLVFTKPKTEGGKTRFSVLEVGRRFKFPVGEGEIDENGNVLIKLDKRYYNYVQENFSDLAEASRVAFPGPPQFENIGDYRKYRYSKLAESFLFKNAGCKKKDPTPEFVDHVAARILKEHPEYTKQQSYAIAVKQLQRYGYLKKGTMELTEKGRRRSKAHYGKRRAVDIHKVK